MLARDPVRAPAEGANFGGILPWRLLFSGVEPDLVAVAAGERAGLDGGVVDGDALDVVDADDGAGGDGAGVDDGVRRRVDDAEGAGGAEAVVERGGAGLDEHAVARAAAGRGDAAGGGVAGAGGASA